MLIRLPLLNHTQVGLVVAGLVFGLGSAKADTWFVVFFGSGVCNVSAEGDQVLSEAAQAARLSTSSRVTVTGHCDTSECPPDQLGKCRADAVFANLVGKGVRESKFRIENLGSRSLQVQTGAGVKEPQNRRVTVVIR